MRSVTLKRVFQLITVLAISFFLFSIITLHLFLISAIGRDSVYQVHSGQSFTEVAEQLKHQQLIPNVFLFKLYAKLTKQDRRLKAGEYQLNATDTPSTLLHKFVLGKVIERPFRISEGVTVREILAELKKSPYLKQEFTGDFNHLNGLLGAQTDSLEGLFYPDTYYIQKGSSDIELLKRAYDKMQKVLRQAWLLRKSNLPYSDSYDALILASIIEKETSLPIEKPRVAAVLINRLNKGMRLQVDPTVIYGLGSDFDGNLTKKLLRKDTPYNTYIRHGLPESPIANPSLSSILAAMNPIESSEFYFVADGLGGHTFSETLEQHNKAVKILIKKQRAGSLN